MDQNNKDYVDDISSDSSDGQQSGVRSRFKDKLNKIRKDRLKWKKKGNLADEEIEEHFLKSVVRNIFKVFLALPSMVYTNIRSDKLEKVNETYKVTDGTISNESYGSKKNKVNQIRDMDVSWVKYKKRIFAKGNESTLKINESVDVSLNAEKQRKIQSLQKEILSLIKKRLVKQINELEILQSELYLLKEIDGNEREYSDCVQDIKEIKRLLSKVKNLKEKYDYLKDNVDFEYMLMYNDDFLIDKILELKELCSSGDILYIVDNYKILEEYKYLYLKIDKLQEDAIEFENNRDKRILELKERNIDFDKLKNDVYDIDKECSKYDDFLKKQDSILANLNNNVSNIDSYEKISYRIKNFDKLLSNSFKYLGLLLVSPLKGLIPGIATQTILTRNMVSNLYNNLEVEESKKMIYTATDYSNVIRSAINNLNDTSSLIDSTLEDVVKLKARYISLFQQYEGQNYEYKEAIKKINKIENAILGSKIKIEKTKQKMKEKEKLNNKKMQRLKKLNSDKN